MVVFNNPKSTQAEQTSACIRGKCFMKCLQSLLNYQLPEIALQVLLSHEDTHSITEVLIKQICEIKFHTFLKPGEKLSVLGHTKN